MLHHDLSHPFMRRRGPSSTGLVGRTAFYHSSAVPRTGKQWPVANDAMAKDGRRSPLALTKGIIRRSGGQANTKPSLSDNKKVHATSTSSTIPNPAQKSLCTSVYLRVPPQGTLLSKWARLQNRNGGSNVGFLSRHAWSTATPSHYVSLQFCRRESGNVRDISCDAPRTLLAAGGGDGERTRMTELLVLDLITFAMERKKSMPLPTANGLQLHLTIGRNWACEGRAPKVTGHGRGGEV